MGMKAHCAVGGTALRDDLATLRNGGVQVVVGCPGRVMDLILRDSLRVDTLKVLILDEADEMLSRGFIDPIRDIMSKLPASCQIGLFSATLPVETLELTERFMKDPVRLVMKQEELTLEGIRQYYVDVGKEDYKLDTIIDLFDSVSVSQCMIFCNTRRKAVWLRERLVEKDFPVDCMHSDLTPPERQQIMEAFIRGSIRVLIATDLMARGIDVQGVEFVLNFDLTRNFENYIHRIGRGGRFGRKGVAINFVTYEDKSLLKQLCAFYSTSIEELPQDFTL